MITASMVAFALLQSAIPATSVTASTDIGLLARELSGSAEPVLARHAVAITPLDIPPRHSFYWTDARGCVRPNGWAGLCRHYPTYASSDVLLFGDMLGSAFRWGDPVFGASDLRRYHRGYCAIGSCYSWLDFGLGYTGSTDFYGWLTRELAEKEFLATSHGLRTGRQLAAQGIGGVARGAVGAGRGARGSSSTGSAYSGSGNFGGGARSSTHAGGDFSGPASGGGAGRSSGGGGGSGSGGGRSGGGSKPGAELP